MMMQVAHASDAWRNCAESGRTVLLRSVILSAWLLAIGPVAAKDSCPQHFAGGRQPVLTNPKLTQDTLTLCYEGFSILHSGISRTPLYAAERLTRARVAAARSVDRADAFREEERLPARDRSELRDYVRSGYDRGHMAPAGDMPTEAAQAESFSLANIVPQNRSANRSLWAAIEESVRRLATRRGDLYVVTGPIFEGDEVAKLNGRVLIPTHLYKAVLDPAHGEAAAYLAPNTASGEWKAVSMAELRRRSGLDVFPSLSDRAKASAMALPEPRAFSRHPDRPRRKEESGVESFLRNEAHRLLRRLWRDLMRSIF